MKQIAIAAGLFLASTQAYAQLPNLGEPITIVVMSSCGTGEIEGRLIEKAWQPYTVIAPISAMSCNAELYVTLPSGKTNRLEFLHNLPDPELGLFVIS